VSPAPQRHPFTLMEVLLATAMLASLMTVVLFSSHGILQSWERMEAHSRDQQELMRLDRTLDSLLNNIVVFTWPDKDKVLQPTLVGTSTEVTLATLHELRRVAEGGMRFSRLRLEGDELVVWTANRPPFPESLPDPRAQRSVLGRGLTSMSFSYADLDGEALVWLDEWQDKAYPPLALRMTLRWYDGRQQNWLRRIAGYGYHERLGNYPRVETPATN
jgi:hypothetical protein